MKKNPNDPTYSEDQTAPPEHLQPEHSEHSHPDEDVQGRFPTREELRIQEAEMGIVRRFDRGEMSERIERHFVELLSSAGFQVQEDRVPTAVESAITTFGLKNVVAKAPRWSEFLKPSIVGLLTAIDHQRLDHRMLDSTDRTRFNEALQAAFADGSYSALAAVHEDMTHRMHSIMGGGYIGGQRFLPWHRIYLVKMENLLRSKRWGVTIPYWNYSDDRARPDWVWQPPNVTRNTPGNGASLPSQATVDNLINNVAAYDAFTNGVEFDAHNDIHNWCNGTISNPMISTRDPIFWLLHANVDRIWDLWQATHSGVPTLTGINATLDPWPQTATDANSIINLGYMYQ